MYSTSNLFSAEEAFNRLGQTREAGCLVIVSAKATARIFTRDAHVVNAFSDGNQGLEVLQKSFVDPQASYVWLPGAKPPSETMSVNICGHALELAIAQDIHLSRTAKVNLDTVNRSTIAPHKRSAGYFLLPMDRPGEKIALNKVASVLGRDDSCDIVVENPQVSRRHCLLQLSARGLSFKDLESANGIYINEIRGKDGLLHSGDRLSMGTSHMHILREPI